MLIIPLFFILILSTCNAWGPLTHQTLACQLYVNDRSSVKECYRTGTNDLCSMKSYILGGSSPDAVKKLNMRLHSFEFAAMQYRLALEVRDKYVPRFDPVSFALAYGTHLAQDSVGHYPTGYLTPEYDHAIELAADTWQYFTYYKPINYTSFPLLLFNDAAIDFITLANQYFANQSNMLHEKFVPFTKEQIMSSILQFESIISLEAAFIGSNFLYKEEMIKFDFCKASDFPTAIKHLQLSNEWNLAASKYWIRLAQSSIDGREIEDKVQEKVKQLFDSHGGTICT